MRLFLNIILLSFFVEASAQQTETELRIALLNDEFAVWNAKNNQEAAEIIIIKSERLTSNGFFNESAVELKRLDTLDYADSNKLVYLKSLNSFLLGNYNDCYNGLLEIKDSVRLSNTEYTVLWLFVLNELENWEECKKLMLNLCDSSNILTSEISNLPLLSQFRSPVKALHLSAYLPGLGQVYAGKTFRGITSFILVTGFTAVTVFCVVNGFYAAGFVYGLMSAVKFYLGGKQFSYQLAGNFNSYQKEQLKDEYRKLIVALGKSK